MAETIAQAYVQILPSTEGIKGQLTNLLGGEADAAGASAGSRLGNAFKTGLAVLGTASVAGMTAASTALVKVGKDALSTYADYEQLVGGVETLFKDSADVVMQYADNAYKTAGLSANQYMETVTSFSASLLQSVGGDTEAAAQIADMAITDMSDNANKMGSSMESIQAAYQGFAKQNYTMLDNLKLGYGGTKEEMERLLADATAISGVEYDISSLSDVYEAIHVVQTELGITGTTAEEASQTISGSLAAMKSSWANLLVGIADENANMDELVNNFVDSVLTVGDNLLPRVEQILGGLSTMIEKLSETLLPVVIDALVSHAPQLLQSGLMIVETLSQAIISNLPALVAAASDIILTLTTDLIQSLPELISVGFDIILTLADALIQALPELIPALVDVILTIVEKLTDPDTLMMLVDVAFQLIGAVAMGLIEAIPKLVEKAPEIISNLAEAILRLGTKIHDAGKELLGKMAEGIISAVSKATDAIGEIWRKIKDTISQKIQEAVQWGKDLIQNFINGLLEKWEALKGKLQGIGSWLGDTFGTKNEVPGAVSELIQSSPLLSNGIPASIGNGETVLRQRMEATMAIGDELRQLTPTPAQTGAQTAPAARVQSGHRQQVAYLVLDRTICGKLVFDLNNAETQRIGVQLALAGGAA